MRQHIEQPSRIASHFTKPSTFLICLNTVISLLKGRRQHVVKTSSTTDEVVGFVMFARWQASDCDIDISCASPFLTQLCGNLHYEPSKHSHPLSLPAASRGHRFNKSLSVAVSSQKTKLCKTLQCTLNVHCTAVYWYIAKSPAANASGTPARLEPGKRHGKAGEWLGDLEPRGILNQLTFFPNR